MRSGRLNWTMRRFVLLLVLLFAWGVQPASAELQHLFTFNGGLTNDPIGGTNAMLQGNVSIDGDGVLQLPGGGGDYVSLNGPAINIPSYTDATFEAWFTVNQLVTWERLFDFGDRTVPAGTEGYVYYTPQGGGGAGLAVYATGGTRTEAPHGVLQTGQLYHLAMVIDDDANGGLDEMNVYLNGALQTSVGHSRSLSNVLNTFAYLGESLISGDPNFNGSIDEFRIYNNAMDLTQVQASFAAGPTPQLSMHLEVNTVTGSVEIVGAEPMPVAFDYYSITSAGGALDPVGWSSLSDRDVDTTGPGVGHSWDEEDFSDSFELVELYLRGASIIDEGERIALGHAFDTSFFGQGLEGDLEFRFARQGSQTLSTAEVVYVTPAPMDGDYNGDLTVNAADYTVWRNSLAGAYNPSADGDGDGTNDHDDYVIWKWNYGNVPELGSGASQQNSIPEPTAALLMLLAMLGSAVILGRRSRQIRS